MMILYCYVTENVDLFSGYGESLKPPIPDSEMKLDRKGLWEDLNSDQYTTEEDSEGTNDIRSSFSSKFVQPTNEDLTMASSEISELWASDPRYYKIIINVLKRCPVLAWLETGFQDHDDGSSRDTWTRTSSSAIGSENRLESTYLFIQMEKCAK
ncbi:hypothetical protein L195_g010412 [Trifolium pratense]|uniref:Uncharacterized protein n=1 Tax=Trifolium pratense TaxID=57577 RepID=A0A2K3PEN0_TRIPR|nr:hypothetical protein L195_g010412 [Trifolium pratense]